MPCADVSEILRLDLDNEDRILFYSLSKDSCGGAVGKPSLLRKWMKNKTTTDVLAISPSEFAHSLNLRSNTWEYLHLKHLLAIQSGLRAMLGEAPAGSTDYCEVESIEHGPDRIKMTARIAVDLMTDEISACSGCGTCDS